MKLSYALISNKNRIKRLTIEGGWIFAGQFVSVLGALFLMRILTDYLEPSEYGRVALALTISSFAGQVILGGIPNVTNRFYSIAIDRGDIKGFMQAVIRYSFIATSVLVSVGFISVFFLFYLGENCWGWLTIVCLLNSILSAYNSGIGAIQNAARRRIVVSIHIGIEGFIKIGFVICILNVFGISSVNVILAYLLSSLVVTLSQLFFLKRVLSKISHETQHENNYLWLPEMWRFSWPMMAGGIINWAYFASHRWALEIFTSTADVGKFSVLTQVSSGPINLAGGVLISFITPIIYSRVGNPDNLYRLKETKRLLLKISINAFTFIFLLALLSFMVKHQIFNLFVSSKYRDVASYMPVMILGAGLFNISLILSILITVSNKTILLLYITFSINIISVLLSLLLSSIYGLSGLIASIISSAILHLAIVLYFISFKLNF